MYNGTIVKHTNKQTKLARIQIQTVHWALHNEATPPASRSRLSLWDRLRGPILHQSTKFQQKKNSVNRTLPNLGKHRPVIVLLLETRATQGRLWSQIEAKFCTSSSPVKFRVWMNEMPEWFFFQFSLKLLYITFDRSCLTGSEIGDQVLKSTATKYKAFLYVGHFNCDRDRS